VARERAEAIIKSCRETMSEIAPMVLSSKDSKKFLEALERDYEPSPSLLALKKHYKSFKIVDET
jgi:uncharacterized protein (DUF1778 family)